MLALAILIIEVIVTLNTCHIIYLRVNLNFNIPMIDVDSFFIVLFDFVMLFGLWHDIWPVVSATDTAMSLASILNVITSY